MKTRKTPKDLGIIIKRIGAIEKNRPGYKEILDFFKYVTREQYKMKPLIKVKPVDINEETAKRQMAEGFPILDKKEMKLNMSSVTTLFKNICRVLQRNSKKIAPEIKDINQALRKGEIDLKELFRKVVEGDRGYLDSIGEKTGLNKWLLTFLAESSVKPFFEAYAEKVKDYVGQAFWLKGYCPVCGSAPAMGELRMETGERFLQCSSCGFKWRYHRMVCPFCGNGNHEKLRYFHTETDGKAYRVDVCEECKKYIKTIDLRELNHEAILSVEDMGTIHLDIIAQEEGYTRGTTNILEMEKSGTA